MEATVTPTPDRAPEPKQNITENPKQNGEQEPKQEPRQDLTQELYKRDFVQESKIRPKQYGQRLHVPAPVTRRSTRSRKAPTKFGEEEYVEKTSPKTTTSDQPSRSSRPPKRQAAQAAQQSIKPEDHLKLVEDALAPMKPDELQEWAGWVELESDPAFFNAMLYKLGAIDFKVEEVFTVDDEGLAMLPKPVYGLVFLFQYVDGDGKPEDHANCPKDLWFGSQTTANSCATVAILNVLMNANSPATLGQKLQSFKNETKDMPPPHRGHMIDANDFIRGIHNSVARRIDLMAEDLLMGNKAEEFEKEQKKKRKPAPRNKKRVSLKRKPDEDTANHYIAYVPVGGKVWELDGLESGPICIGAYDTNHGVQNDGEIEAWLTVAQQGIKKRMGANEGLYSFNLLAICHSPLSMLPWKLAISIVKSQHIHDKFGSHSAWSIADPRVTFPMDTYKDKRLTSLNLKPADLNEAGKHLPEDFRNKIKRDSFDITEAADMATQLQDEQQRLERQFRDELAQRQDALDIMQDRQRDYTPAIFEWLKQLQQSGKLKGLLEKYRQEEER